MKETIAVIAANERELIKENRKLQAELEQFREDKKDIADNLSDQAYKLACALHREKKLQQVLQDAPMPLPDVDGCVVFEEYVDWFYGPRIEELNKAAQEQDNG